MSTINVITLITLKDCAKLKNELEALVNATRKEEDCIQYNCLANVEDGNKIAFFEEWKSRESLEKHMRTEHFLKWKEACQGETVSSEMGIYKKEF